MKFSVNKGRDYTNQGIFGGQQIALVNSLDEAEKFLKDIFDTRKKALGNPSNTLFDFEIDPDNNKAADCAIYVKDKVELYTIDPVEAS